MPFCKSFAALALVVAVALAGAPSAGARTAIPVKGEVGSPQLAGDEVVFGTESADGRMLEIRRARPGEPSRVVRSFRNARRDRNEDALLVFGASAGALSVSYIRGVSDAENDDFTMLEAVSEAGPLDGPWRQSACGQVTGQEFVSGSRVASYCIGPEGPMIVTDVATGAELARIPRHGDFLTIAGDYLYFSVVENGEKHNIVWNYVEGREVYQVPSGPVALQADGKLAAGRVTPDGCLELRWYQPGDPTGHLVAKCIDYVHEMAGDRIAYTERATKGHSGALVIAGLDGSNHRIEGTFDRIDLDEKRVLYRCILEDRFVVQGVEEPGTGCTPTLRVDTHVVRATRGSKIRLPITCTMGCSGSILLHRSGQLGSNEPGFRIDSPDTNATVTLKLRRGVRLPRKGRTFNVTVEWADGAGNGHTAHTSIRVLPPRR